MRKTTPKRKVPRSKETPIVKAALELLSGMGYFAWKLNSGDRFGEYTSKKTGKTSRWRIRGCPPGTPDIIVRLGRRGSPDPAWAFLEVKRPGGDRRPDQVTWHREASEAGVLVATIESAADALRHVQEWAGRAK